MAQQTPIALSPAQRKQELTSQLANSRRVISRERVMIKNGLSPKKQARNFFINKPKGALIGSAIVGLLVSSIFKRKKRAKGYRKSRGLMMTLVFALAKPALKTWLTKKVTSIAAQKMSERGFTLPLNQQPSENNRPKGY